jgi:hypothetical protein
MGVDRWGGIDLWFKIKITLSSSSLIDAMITDKIFYPSETKMMEKGYSDHFAVVMNVSINLSSTTNTMGKRFLSQKSIDMFNCQLSSELWSDVYLQSDVNRAYSHFLTKFTMFLYRFLPPKKVQRNQRHKSCWITKGIKVSRQRL